MPARSTPQRQSSWKLLRSWSAGVPLSSFERRRSLMRLASSSGSQPVAVCRSVGRRNCTTPLTLVSTTNFLSSRETSKRSRSGPLWPSTRQRRFRSATSRRSTWPSGAGRWDGRSCWRRAHSCVHVLNAHISYKEGREEIHEVGQPENEAHSGTESKGLVCGRDDPVLSGFCLGQGDGQSHPWEWSGGLQTGGSEIRQDVWGSSSSYLQQVKHSLRLLLDVVDKINHFYNL